MDCSLWFDRCRINSAADIREHFDLAALRGYFLGGRLIEWLREHGGQEQADLLSGLTAQEPELDRRLCEIFGQKLPEVRAVFRNEGGAADPGGRPGGSFSGSGSFFGGSSGSYTANYASFFGSGVFSGSYSANSSGFFGSRGSFSAFRLWEWEWEWRFGGSRGSFRRGSFLGHGSYLLGSYIGGSFHFGSYRFGSWGYIAGAGSFNGNGSFPGYISMDEYDRIMYECLRKCPLDCFGYGIHII